MSTNLKDDVGKAVNDTFNDILNFNEEVCGKKYKVAFQIDRDCSIRWASGTLMNFNCGNVDIKTDDGYVIHIPYNGLKWLLPANKKEIYIGGINNEI